MDDPDDINPSNAYGTDALGRLGRGLEWIVEMSGRIAMFLVLALVLLVSANVVLRYFFSIGPVSMQELEWHILAPVAMIGCAYTMRHHGHVRVDLLYDKFAPRTQNFVNLFTSIALFILCVLTVKLSLNFVSMAYDISEGSPDPGGLPHRFLLKAMVPLGFTLLAIQAAAHSILYFTRITGSNS
ncbi:2,3-diketo-L-gulonate TRAP transporter small permease protein YiaM [Roseovarius sp. A-2]|uniref:TRAP transporter small permease subunit n=1 Tax=Roseovarius sp. A-2 TaxID=1570360 RepID=UPI0009B58D22|nr:TRAP transporter small permease subunit [Roseovarius sp. A-2]GAW35070.1 2,3-diketo-L-gulonate TRAP transporter small permease protein YiaM [Roseovarius sp. A-2]